MSERNPTRMHDKKPTTASLSPASLLSNENIKGLNPLLLPLPWLAILLLVIIFLSVKYGGDTAVMLSPKTTAKEFPHIFMEDVDMREFEVDGSLRYQLKTPLIRHFQIGAEASADDYTRFDLPQIVFLGNEEKPAWYITAKLGNSDKNGDLLTLTTDVLAQQISQSQGTVSITTEELSLNTQEQFAQTNKAVTMRAAKGHIETLGMRVDIKKDLIELLSNVKGTYEP
jgi:lipopolysaccharide export system protein LptC